MLTRYFQLKPRLDQRDSDLIPFLLSPAQEINLRELLTDLRALDSVSKTMQKNETTMQNVRVFFDSIPN